MACRGVASFTNQQGPAITSSIIKILNASRNSRLFPSLKHNRVAFLRFLEDVLLCSSMGVLRSLFTGANLLITILLLLFFQSSQRRKCKASLLQKAAPPVLLGDLATQRRSLAEAVRG